MISNESLSQDLLKSLPRDQIKKVMIDQDCDIDGEFLGFLSIYKSLSEIIPEHFTMVDIGCAYNPQCYYFQKHKRYIAVDNHKKEIFKTDNVEHFTCGVSRFIDYFVPILNLNMKETFAIMNYVPLSDNHKAKVRRTFENIYCYYPHSDNVILIPRV